MSRRHAARAVKSKRAVSIRASSTWVRAAARVADRTRRRSELPALYRHVDARPDVAQRSRRWVLKGATDRRDDGGLAWRATMGPVPAGTIRAAGEVGLAIASVGLMLFRGYYWWWHRDNDE